MCFGDDPVVRALPYLISGLFFAIVTILLYIPRVVKGRNLKYVKISKFVLMFITGILLLSATIQYYILRPLCL